MNDYLEWLKRIFSEYNHNLTLLNDLIKKSQK